jgi:hypothetical protein
MTVNEIFYSGTFRHLAAGDRRSEPGRLWATDAELVPLEQAQAPHEAETLLAVREHGTANALALWFSAELVPGISLSVGPGDAPTHWGDDDGPAALPCAAHARHGRPRQSQDRPGPAGRDMDELGRRAARRGLGGARRAGRLAGDRRLNNPKNPDGRTCAADLVARGRSQRSWQRSFRTSCGPAPASCRSPRHATRRAAPPDRPLGSSPKPDNSDTSLAAIAPARAPRPHRTAGCRSPASGPARPSRTTARPQGLADRHARPRAAGPGQYTWRSAGDAIHGCIGVERGDSLDVAQRPGRQPGACPAAGGGLWIHARDSSRMRSSHTTEVYGSLS